jgi:hypothetical protein
MLRAFLQKIFGAREPLREEAVFITLGPPESESKSPVVAGPDAGEANEKLRDAAERGDIGGIRAAMAEGADNLNWALFAATEAGEATAVAYLLDCGADPNAITHSFGRFIVPLSTLRRALDFGREELFELLIERGGFDDRVVFEEALLAASDLAPEMPLAAKKTAWISPQVRAEKAICLMAEVFQRGHSPGEELWQKKEVVNLLDMYTRFENDHVVAACIRELGEWL